MSSGSSALCADRALSGVLELSQSVQGLVAQVTTHSLAKRLKGLASQCLIASPTTGMFADPVFACWLSGGLGGWSRAFLKDLLLCMPRHGMQTL